MSVFIMINSFVLTKKSYLYCHFLGNLHEHVFNFLTEKFQTCTSCESIQRKINFFFKISDCYLFLNRKKRLWKKEKMLVIIFSFFLLKNVPVINP